jgi:hypothetical protein
MTRTFNIRKDPTAGIWMIEADRLEPGETVLVPEECIGVPVVPYDLFEFQGYKLQAIECDFFSRRWRCYVWDVPSWKVDE